MSDYEVSEEFVRRYNSGAARDAHAVRMSEQSKLNKKAKEKLAFWEAAIDSYNTIGDDDVSVYSEEEQGFHSQTVQRYCPHCQCDSTFSRDPPCGRKGDVTHMLWTMCGDNTPTLFINMNYYCSVCLHPITVTMVLEQQGDLIIRDGAHPIYTNGGNPVL